ncbi:hypothetical protein [Intrasporangium oryzae]|uniref:hypothetical protein n=1 Tax=Intrasporangium oryzae TaxID=412687 RepID=UPI0012FBB2C3|nr:hypothetical protein [Intrasporangium oryzae]
MGPWKSHFEMVIPQCTPSRLAEVARDRGGGWLKVGLIVRVRGGRIRARYNEMSRGSSAPLLKGDLVQESAGTRIVGEIQWTNVVAPPLVLSVVSFVSLVIGAAICGDDRSLGIFFLLSGAAFGAFVVFEFRGEGSQRAFEERRLREELLSVLVKHGRR